MAASPRTPMNVRSARPWPVVLAHGGLMLRPLQASDEAAWNEVRARNHGWTGPWDATRPAEDDGAPLTFRGMVNRLNKSARAGHSLPWAITVADDAASRHVLAGQLTISGITYGSARWAQAGYWIDHRHAGRGLVPLALALATDYLVDVLRLHRLEVAIRPENGKSVRVVQKLGLRYEGRRPNYLHVDGDWRDHDVYVLHADERPAGGLVAHLGRPAPDPKLR